MHIKTIEMFPDYKTELPPACSAYKRKVASKATLARLERALSSGDGSVTRQVRVYVSFSSMNGHTAHTFGMALAYGQPMNPEVSAKINMFVQHGTTSVTQVQKCLQFYVEHVLFAGKPNPPPSCRAFYPTREDIRSHIQSCIRKDRYSSVDQVNAGRLVEELQEKDPAGKYFFQPYKNQRQDETLAPEINDEDNILEGMANKCEQTLMFCMQTAFMKMAMEKYSGDVVCLDATNKTTDYSLPLFFFLW
ncbi:hypothetical protein MRX96_005444 [Rhipicephalus microplus]